jgi:hypothetical protein
VARAILAAVTVNLEEVASRVAMASRVVRRNLAVVVVGRSLGEDGVGKISTYTRRRWSRADKKSFLYLV